MLVKLLKKQFPTEKILEKGKDIIVYSKNRIETKKETEKFLAKNKIAFQNVFKVSKSSSLEVISVDKQDIIFKPIIAKGAGGVAFEKELKIDLENFFKGAEYQDLLHPDVIKELENVLALTPDSNWNVKLEGSKNQRREFVFNGTSASITNSSGQTLTDLTLNKNGKNTYLSIKKSPTYYTLSASVLKYFLNPQTKKSINEYFGFDGNKMGGFGKEYAVETKRPNYSTISRNLSEVLSQAVGNNVVLVHKKQTNDVLVSKIGSTNNVIVSNISDNSYAYPEENVRKYANIKFSAKINGHNYEVNFQFRGTTAVDKGPKYLRILLERL